MRKEAGLKGRYSNIRLGTIARLEIACDDILSGKAYQLADAQGYAQNDFPHTRPQLTYSLIGKYVKMRQRAALPDRAEWTGPAAAVVSRDKDLKAYVDARRVEAFAARPRKARSNTAIALEEIIAKLPIEDRYIVRGEIEKGRSWKQELDLAHEFSKRMQPVRIEDLNPLPRAEQGRASSELLDSDETELLRRLLVRLKNVQYLEPFGLGYSDGLLKMNFSPGRILIEGDEMAVIARLAGMPL
jgi:hypothetical protein